MINGNHLFFESLSFPIKDRQWRIPISKTEQKTKGNEPQNKQKGKGTKKTLQPQMLSLLLFSPLTRVDYVVLCGLSSISYALF